MNNLNQIIVNGDFGPDGSINNNLNGNMFINQQVPSNLYNNMQSNQFQFQPQQVQQIHQMQVPQQHQTIHNNIANPLSGNLMPNSYNQTFQNQQNMFIQQNQPFNQQFNQMMSHFPQQNYTNTNTIAQPQQIYNQQQNSGLYQQQFGVFGNQQLNQQTFPAMNNNSMMNGNFQNNSFQIMPLSNNMSNSNNSNVDNSSFLDFQRRLEENEKLLSDWEKILEVHKKFPVEKFSQDDIAVHAIMRKRIHDNLNELVKYTQIHKMRRAKSGSSQQNQHNTTSSSGLQLFPAQGENIVTKSLSTESSFSNQNTQNLTTMNSNILPRMQPNTGSHNQ